MWVRKSSIRPVPSYARIEARTLEQVRTLLASDEEEDGTQSVLDDAFERFDDSQEALSRRLADVLNRPLGDTALALGYFSYLAVWMAFDLQHGRSLAAVGEEELEATEQLLRLDEHLREDDPQEPLETDDVVAMEQPELVRFVHEYLEATLEEHGEGVELEAVQTIYRMVLVEMLALSYAVRAPLGYPTSRGEVVA
ncbi:MAG TPA: hypothetical protein VLC09_05570 [Polyangiaceae bacterium]|nr:hypothetical protein [Polyangiaceae bacterium]